MIASLQTECRLGYVSEIRVVCLPGVSSKGILSVGEFKCETTCYVVVNHVRNVYPSVRSERFVIGSVAVTSCVCVCMCDRWLDMSRQRASRSMLDSLMFTRGHSHKSIEPSHVVRRLWGQWLAIRGRPSFRLALWSVGRAST